MAVPTTAVYVGGIACTPDGAVYVEPTGNASITGGSITGLTTLSIAEGAITSGVYTPTLTNTTNVAASVAYQCQYMRVGSVVTVSGRFEVDPTTASVATVLSMTVPIASNFASLQDAGGVAYCTAAAGYGMGIYADTVNDRVNLEFVCGANVSSLNWFFTFTYRII